MTGKDRFLYDTDVIIDYLKGEEQARSLLEVSDCKQAISVITVLELYAGVRNKREEEVIGNLIDYFDVIELSKEIAKMGGNLKRKYYKSHNVAIPDAIIGATAMIGSFSLKTLNVKHYPMIDGLMPAYVKK